MNILPASDIIEDGLNRFFVSEYFRTFFAGDSQTAQIIASLNRFFVSEYFRTGESGVVPLLGCLVSIASSSANTSGLASWPR